MANAEIFVPQANFGVGAWIPTGSLTAARGNHTATLLPSGKVLVAGGWINNYPILGALASAEIYDPAAYGGVGAWIPTCSLHTARFVHTATLLPNGKVLAAGGADTDAVSLVSAELYQPGSSPGISLLLLLH